MFTKTNIVNAYHYIDIDMYIDLLSGDSDFKKKIWYIDMLYLLYAANSLKIKSMFFFNST